MKVYPVARAHMHANEFVKVKLMPPVIVIWPSRLNQPARDKAFVSATASCRSTAFTAKVAARSTK